MPEASALGDENGILMQFVDWFCQYLDPFGIEDFETVAPEPGGVEDGGADVHICQASPG